MSLIRDYFIKTVQHKAEYGESTLVLMQVGAFYEVYGLQSISCSNILEFASICDLNIADKKILVDGYNVIMAGFSLSSIDRYLRKMQEAGYTIVVYNQRDLTNTSKEIVRYISGIYSPGTFFSESVSMLPSNVTMSIWIQKLKKQHELHGVVQVGVSTIDIYTGRTSIFQFEETYIKSPTTFDELERLVSIYSPSEVLIVANMKCDEIDQVLSYTNLETCRAIHKLCMDDHDNPNHHRATNCEKQTYQYAILKQFYQKLDVTLFAEQFVSQEIGTQSFCYLLDFIYIHNPFLVNNIMEPEFENSSDRMILANHTLKQLNIVSDNNSLLVKTKCQSVQHLLNLCITPMGVRRFSKGLLNPTMNVNYLRKEYDMTEHLLSDDNIVVEDILSRMKDMSKALRKINMKKASPKLIFQLYLDMRSAHALSLRIAGDDMTTSYFGASQINDIVERICLYMESTLNLEYCSEVDTMSQFTVNFIKPDINEELDVEDAKLRIGTTELESIGKYFNEKLDVYENKSSKGLPGVTLHETEKHNFSFQATKRRCAKLNEFIKNCGQSSVILQHPHPLKLQLDCITFHSQTASNDIISSAQITGLCDKVTSAKVRVKSMISDVFQKEILEHLSLMSEDFNRVIDFVSLVDVTFAKATMAKKYCYCKPTIDNECGDSFIEAINMRHPLIEHLRKDEIYVANDVVLGKQRAKGVLLYGTNAVGKTSYIRAIGISIIMAQSGLYVPCKSFHYRPYRSIFTRILANDNLFKGLSTFAVEMSELRTILRRMDCDSLILGDELCSGTESVSAVAIFIAGINQMSIARASYVFATHMHEILAFDEIKRNDNLNIRHMTVRYDRETNQLVYDRKLKNGAGDSMYGLEVCKAMNLPEDFLEMAHEIRQKYYPSSRGLLSMKTSHFNSYKIIALCEMCNNEMGSEVHHINGQKNADSFGIITTKETSFHKNHTANLLTLCAVCHDAVHRERAKK